jgi:FkbM family methyltransferase
MEDIKAFLQSLAETQQGLVETQREFEEILQSLLLNDSTIIDALAQMLGAIQQMQTRSDETQNRLADELRSLSVQLLQPNGKTGGNQAFLPVDEFTRENPDVGLLEYLYSFLNDRKAIDVGANAGLVSERLLKAGYSVHAFEPYPPAFEKLQDRLSSNSSFRAMQYAIGSSDGVADLHVASDLTEKGKWDPTLFNSLVEHPMLDDCKFTQTLKVQVRSLESLRSSGEIPHNAGLLKIDTEGFDLEVIRGMGSARYQVVMTEFWDSQHPFGLSGNGNLQDTVKEMKERGYYWHVVIYRVDETSTLSYYLNRDQTIAKSWGNTIFFQDYLMFVRAAAWCESVLAQRLSP